MPLYIFTLKIVFDTYEQEREIIYNYENAYIYIGPFSTEPFKNSRIH